MKDQRKIIVIVLVAILVLLLLRRVSGFIVTPQTVPLSMMDLQEFSYLSDDKKNQYRSLLTSRAPLFTSNTSNYTMYMQTVTGVMSTVMSATPSAPSMMCPNSNVLMGVCLTAPGMCPLPMIGTLVLQTGNRYCKCPATAPFLRRNTMTTSTNGVCSSTSCSSSQQRTITETVSGQQECVSVCPTNLPPGLTCV